MKSKLKLPDVGVRPDAEKRTKASARAIAQTSNPRLLYDRGRRYEKRLSELITSKFTRSTAIETLAVSARRPRQEIRDAIAYANAVDHIVEHAGPASKKALLSRNSRFTPKAVLQIAGTHAERIRYAMTCVREGRSPFASPPPGTNPPFDTLHYGEVISRLARAAGLVDYVSRSAASVVHGLKADLVEQHIAEIRRACDIVRSQLRGPVSVAKKVVGITGSLSNARASSAITAGRSLAAAAGLARKNGRDIARLVAEQPPTARQVTDVMSMIGRLLGSVQKLETIQRTRLNTAQRPSQIVTPARTAGTYAVLFYLATPLKHHVVGKVGTLNFAIGYYGYVGSAFGAGGVAARVGRHLSPNTVKKWNIDFLKDKATPVEVWWTHDPVKRECQWSAALATLPGLTAPALGFGSNDCVICDAHLYHAVQRPQFEHFEAAVRRIEGHAPVFSASPAAFLAPGEDSVRATPQRSPVHEVTFGECRHSVM